MTVGEFAKTLHRDLSEVIKKLMALGIMATINQELDLDAIQLVCAEFGVEVDLRLPVEEENSNCLRKPTIPPTSSRGRRSSPSWGMSTTARRRCSTPSAIPT